MKIHGLQKLTLLDYPGHTACTVFTAGCNFRCPFCHNAALVTEIDAASFMEEEEFFRFLKKRQGILDGVCITGGEPLLQPDIESFMQKIKDLGFAVKLDTNGSFPEKLESLIKEGLVDYVAMDIKNCLEKYSLTAGVTVDTAAIEKSIDLLLSGHVEYEFRTTVVKQLHIVDDIEKIAMRIRGAKRYFLQNFVDSGNLIEEGFSAHDAENMEKMRLCAAKYVPSCVLRGI